MNWNNKGPKTAELRKLVAKGATLRPVFGLKDPVHYEPRTKYDPQPWTDGNFRYHAWELTPDEETDNA